MPPPIEQFHPLGESLTPVIGAGNLVVVCVIKGKFHRIAGESLIAGEGGEGAAPAMGRMLPFL